MAKANMAADTTDTTETGDAPLIDLNEASIKKLIARAKKRGYITYDQLNEALPQDQMSSDQLEDIMAALNEMGVNIVENEEQGEDGESEEEADDAADATTRTAMAARSPRRRRRKPSIVPTIRSACTCARDGRGRTAQPRGRNRHRQADRGGSRHDDPGAVRESPITFNAIIDWSTALNEGTMQLREILDLDAMLSKDAGPENLGEEDEDDNGEISAKNAGPQFKEEEEPEDPRSMARMKRAANAAGPAPRTRKRTTPCPSPDGGDAQAAGAGEVRQHHRDLQEILEDPAAASGSPWRWAASCRAEERKYHKLREELTAEVESVQFHNAKIEFLVDQLYAFNRRLTALGGQMLRWPSGTRSTARTSSTAIWVMSWTRTGSIPCAASTRSGATSPPTKPPPSTASAAKSPTSRSRPAWR